jgi:hypothetical protein
LKNLEVAVAVAPLIMLKLMVYDGDDAFSLFFRGLDQESWQDLTIIFLQFPLS